MPRLDLMTFFRRGKKPHEAFAERDATLVEWSKSDGYRAIMDLWEREMRAIFLGWLSETDPLKLDDLRARGRAIYDLIRLVDRKAATVQAAEAAKEFAERQVAEMPADRAELQELDRALLERALVAPDARRPPATRPASQPVY